MQLQYVGTRVPLERNKIWNSGTINLRLLLPVLRSAMEKRITKDATAVMIPRRKRRNKRTFLLSLGIDIFSSGSIVLYSHDKTPLRDSSFFRQLLTRLTRLRYWHYVFVFVKRISPSKSFICSFFYMSWKKKNFGPHSCLNKNIPRKISSVFIKSRKKRNSPQQSFE